MYDSPPPVEVGERSSKATRGLGGQAAGGGPHGIRQPLAEHEPRVLAPHPAAVAGPVQHLEAVEGVGRGQAGQGAQQPARGLVEGAGVQHPQPAPAGGGLDVVAAPAHR
eukprot:CAMPEP_0194720202 /NCGR_PEP_ID=MMETSP0296-20130528/11538_1 /TAXON_ID=39354 /ORGANISM="Heterosigma akashiwo, Strain CCMP2393" /LENGTH=108 /DNA_ID=CAMNT_0039622249 /DNA_START=54 /DNA_END=378 /DNA_ORIENTATION=-